MIEFRAKLVQNTGTINDVYGVQNNAHNNASSMNYYYNFSWNLAPGQVPTALIGLEGNGGSKARASELGGATISSSDSPSATGSRRIEHSQLADTSVPIPPYLPPSSSTPLHGLPRSGLIIVNEIDNPTMHVLQHPPRAVLPSRYVEEGIRMIMDRVEALPRPLSGNLVSLPLLPTPAASSRDRESRLSILPLPVTTNTREPPNPCASTHLRLPSRSLLLILVVSFVGLIVLIGLIILILLYPRRSG